MLNLVILFVSCVGTCMKLGARFANCGTTRRRETGLIGYWRETEDQGSSYATLHELYTDSSADGIKYSLEEIRNYAAFHYPQGGFERALETHAEEGELIIAQYSGLSRYVVMDSFATTKVLEVAGGTRERFQDLVGKVIHLVGALGTAMDHILVGVFKLRPTAIVGQESGSVEIPKALERAREYVEQLRTGEARE